MHVHLDPAAPRRVSMLAQKPGALAQLTSRETTMGMRLARGVVVEKRQRDGRAGAARVRDSRRASRGNMASSKQEMDGEQERAAAPLGRLSSRALTMRYNKRAGFDNATMLSTKLISSSGVMSKGSPGHPVGTTVGVLPKVD